MYFAYFHSFAPPKSSNMDNYWMVMAFFGNHISKCNRLSKNTRPIQAVEVLYRLRNNQKHYLIYSETPCRREWSWPLGPQGYEGSYLGSVLCRADCKGEWSWPPDPQGYKGSYWGSALCTAACGREWSRPTGCEGSYWESVLYREWSWPLGPKTLKGVNGAQCYIKLIVRGNALNLYAPKVVKGVTNWQGYVELHKGENHHVLQAPRL